MHYEHERWTISLWLSCYKMNEMLSEVYSLFCGIGGGANCFNKYSINDFENANSRYKNIINIHFYSWYF